jgi:hypothetical protein
MKKIKNYLLFIIVSCSLQADKKPLSPQAGIVGIPACRKPLKSLWLLSHPTNKSSCLLQGEKMVDNGCNRTHPTP